MFSTAEAHVIKILGRRKMTIHEIVEKYYDEEYLFEPPMDADNYIGRVVRRITQKCAHFKLTWTIVGTRSAHGRTVWRKPLKSKKA